MNLVKLSGKVSRIGELRGNEVKAIDFTIGATNDRNKALAFCRCVAFHETAEKIADRIKDGDTVAIEGRISTRTTEYKGVKKFITEIYVDGFEKLA